MNLRASYEKIWSDYDQREYSLSFEPGIKFSDQFSMNYKIDIRKKLLKKEGIAIIGDRVQLTEKNLF